MVLRSTARKPVKESQTILHLARHYGLLTLADPCATLSHSYLHYLTLNQKADALKFM
jgi:hypothetical protein